MTLSCSLVVLSVCCTGALVVNGFSSPTISLAQRQQHQQHQHQARQREREPVVVPSRLYSSSPVKDNDDGDDELSRLIDKRNEIKRNIKKSTTTTSTDGGGGGEEPTPESLEFDISEDDLDWDQLPEFQTKRVARNKQSSSSSSSKSSSDSKKKNMNDDHQEKASGLDYLADYADEGDFHIPNRIGISTVAWGDVSRGFVTSGRASAGGGGKLTKKMRREGKFVPGDLQVAYNTLLERGISFVETSESYGRALRSSSLSAEHILARCMEEHKTDNAALIATTVANSLFSSLRLGGANAIVKAAEASCSRLDTSGVELLQVQRTWLHPGLVDGLAKAVDKGYCNSVGACNLGKGGIKSFCRKLERRGLTLTSNQFEFSLTNRRAWKSGLIDACKERGVIPLVRNPLDGGLASGRYTATNPSGGEAGGSARYPFSKLERLQPLHSVHETVAERASVRVKRELRDMKERYKSRYGPGPKINTDITTTQVAINYVIAKGAVPICDVTDSRQAEEILGCLGWGLTEDEVDMLDSAADLCGL